MCALGNSQALISLAFSTSKTQVQLFFSVDFVTFVLLSFQLFPPCTPPGRNGKKPVKTLDTDGKLEDDSTTVTCKDIVSDITGGFPASDNPEAALQTLFTLLAVLPSARLGLVDAKNLTLSGDGTCAGCPRKMSALTPHTTTSRPMSCCNAGISMR